MEIFKRFLRDINKYSEGEITLNNIRQSISRINQFLYQTHPGLGGTTTLNDEYFEYFSEFHKFWDKHHQEILNPQIDDDQCLLVAEALHAVLMTYGKPPFYELYDTSPLKADEICKVRYFSANQDFRSSRNFDVLIKTYQDDPSIFDKTFINKNPEDFLKDIGIIKLSQNDKRVKYAVTASQVLIDKDIEPYELLEYFGNDIEKVRTFLTSNRGSGFGNKKTDMFLRDMVVLGVWNHPNNFDKIDVASDINTIKVALRSRILQIEIPLVSSFLDIFCYQYSLIDEMNAFAWRKVWEQWNNKYPTECIESPCLIDYFVYRVIGKEFCKESLCFFQCATEEHTFKWHSGRNRTCQICVKEGKKSKASMLYKVLPCADIDGCISIEKSKFVSGQQPLLPDLKECPLESVCKPKTAIFRKFNPPKSISILGQTGWESARTKADEGGGGLMS